MDGPFLAAGLEELVEKFIRPDDHVHFAATMSRPNAVLHATARAFQNRKSLTVSVASLHSNAHALALSNSAKRVITCFLGDSYPSPRPCRLYRSVSSGEPFAAENWTLLSYVQRLMAAALGQPYAVTTSLAGTDLVTGKEGVLFTIPDPECDERTVTLLKPLRPDIAVYHGVCADERGNIVLSSPHGEGVWAAYAARRGVVASVERIVPTDVMAAHSPGCVIPSQRVLAICEAPRGAHPQSLDSRGIAEIEGYDDDYRFMQEASDACAEAPRAKAWFDAWIGLPGGHQQYLAKLDAHSNAGIFRNPRPTVLPGPERNHPGPLPTQKEALIILGARTIVEKVSAARSSGPSYDTLLAGVGVSHIAAWLAADQLRTSGMPIKVVAEWGLYGMLPEPGDTYLFSRSNAQRCEASTGIAEILGGMVAGNRRCLGVIAAAEIDESGAVNTSRLRDGRWITGSGGGNDVASNADSIVIALASPERYVRKVAYVTSPGARILDVVSQFGAFRRSSPEEKFELGSCLTVGMDGNSADPKQLVARYTSWTAETENARAEPYITSEELSRVRRLDPDGIYRS
ncbi:CoA-transferase [Streptomyces sp. NPDC058701]|uniref:CoA-transferase n=1 Tax=Streptomyces sp. NPDC058701 TaxID=3346608 RepID=UPI003659B6C3